MKNRNNLLLRHKLYATGFAARLDSTQQVEHTGKATGDNSHKSVVSQRLPMGTGHDPHDNFGAIEDVILSEFDFCFSSHCYLIVLDYTINHARCYKQPKIPDSYAPRRCYMKPSAPVECCTTYKMSYLPVDGCKNLRGEARKPAPNLVPSCEPMESGTVQKLSFLPNPVCVTQPIRPCHHDMWGQGPMQNLTTQRHDYVPKPCVLRESFKPAPKLHCVETPFENRTVNKLSYLPPDKIELAKSFAPQRCYEKPAAKMDCATTHKMSFMPNQVLAKEPLPWACKGQYQKPCQKLEDNTTYSMSFLNPDGDCRRRAIIPNSCTNPVTASKRFETQTVYKNRSNG
ncbi:unnamed protein product [Leptidea sinapis]|uniref:Uncharacterized protein n=1 Tax=Leptidea sinapis TaxID=189913 RepID=A0A5E4PRA0_9NEOP|nr:unnamed protein product [Leptidea sinapis]